MSRLSNKRIREFVYMFPTCMNCQNEGDRMKPLQVHHIDENPNNNSIENLAVLCMSCHAKTQLRHKKYWKKVRFGNYFLTEL